MMVLLNKEIDAPPSLLPVAWPFSAWVADFTLGQMPAGITFSRASGGEVFSAGTFRLAGTDMPRLDTQPTTGVNRGLLVETSRTNLLINSDTLTTQSVTVSAQAYTLSFYGTGTVTLSGAYSGLLAGTGNFPTRSMLTFTPAAGSLTLTVSGAVQFAGLEAGIFASSYIPTAGASATRAGDSASYTNFAGLGVNPAEGTFIVEWERIQTTSDSGRVIGSMYKAATGANDRVWLEMTGNGAIVAMGKTNGGVNDINLAIPGTPTAFCRAALAYRNGDMAGCLNGGTVATSSAGTVPAGLDRFSIGSQAGSYQANSWIRKVSYFPLRLANPALQMLTTW